MRNPRPLAWSMAAALTAAAVFAPVRAEERLSLSERMSRLEQQQQGQGQNVELLNRLNELQQELQNDAQSH